MLETHLDPLNNAASRNAKFIKNRQFIRNYIDYLQVKYLYNIHNSTYLVVIDSDTYEEKYYNQNPAAYFHNNNTINSVYPQKNYSNR